MRKSLLQSSRYDREKLRNFLDNTTTITVQKTLEGTIEAESKQEADRTKQRRADYLEEMKQDARFEKEANEADKISKSLDPLRERLHELDLKLNELSGGGEFFEGFAFMGLECKSLRDLKALAKKLWRSESISSWEWWFANPEVSPFMTTLIEAVKVNRDFYLRYHGIQNLLEISKNEDISMHNIATFCKWLGIRSDLAPEIPATFFD